MVFCFPWRKIDQNWSCKFFKFYSWPQMNHLGSSVCCVMFYQFEKFNTVGTGYLVFAYVEMY